MVEEFNRHTNKLLISKIIKTDNNLSDDLAEKFLEFALETKEYNVHIDEEQDSKYWEGYTKKYVKSYKTKTKYKKNSKEENKEYDPEINELVNDENVFMSKIYKNSFVIRKNATANYNYIDTIILPDINLICIIGNSKFISKPKDILYDFLNRNGVEFKEINIENDFILWMLWKLYKNEPISQNIKLESFENLRVGVPNANYNDYDDGPLNIKTEGSKQILPSLPICYGLFNKRLLNHFRGEFIYNKNHYIVIIDITKNEINDDFEQESKIHILSSESLDDLFYSQKLELALVFIYELTNLICNWQEFENNLKYPDNDYIETLFKKAVDDFEETKAVFDEYKTYYAKKRKT